MDTKRNKESDKAVYDSLRGIIADSSETLSKVARTIVIALCGLCWVEFNGHRDSVELGTALCLVIGYFFLELIQYLIPAWVARNNFLAYRDKGRQYDKVKESMDGVSHITLAIEVIKLLALVAILGVMLVYFFPVR